MDAKKGRRPNLIKATTQEEILQEIAHLDRAGLLRLKDELDESLRRTRDNLQAVRANAVKSGFKLDPKWVASTEFSLKVRKRQSQVLQLRITEVNKKYSETCAEAERQRRLRFESQFISVAKRRLPPALFEEVVKEAEARVAEEKDGR